MYDGSLTLFETLFCDDGQLAVDRALAELRAGRPIVVEAPDGPQIMAAFDAIAPSVLEAFARLGNSVLILSQVRARVLGLAADGSVALAIAGLDRAAIGRLATGLDVVTSVNWQPADAVAAIGIELCKHALLLPAALVARGGFGGEMPASIYRLGLERVKSLLRRDRHALEIVSRAQVPLVEAADASLVVFRGGPVLRDQVAIVMGNPDPARPVLVRMHSACLTGDLFGSLRCDCGDQLRSALTQLAEEGGVLLYLDQEGRGTGIRNKMRAYALQDDGLDTIDADAALGYAPDERRYDIAASMLAALGYRRIRLLTNNPDKLDSLRRAGIEVVGRRALPGAVTAENRNYLATKVLRAGHLLNGYLKPGQSIEGTEAAK